MLVLKPLVDSSYEDFWYDLIEGGYLNIDQLLEDNEDKEKLKLAVDLVKSFQELLDHNNESYI